MYIATGAGDLVLFVCLYEYVCGHVRLFTCVYMYVYTYVVTAAADLVFSIFAFALGCGPGLLFVFVHEYVCVYVRLFTDIYIYICIYVYCDGCGWCGALDLCLFAWLGS